LRHVSKESKRKFKERNKEKGNNEKRRDWKKSRIKENWLK
jgi:hypothetical protein